VSATTQPSARGRTAELVLFRPRRRMATDVVMRSLSGVATVLILIPLVAVISMVILKGFPAITIEFLTQPPIGFEGGGALASILGTLQMVPLAALFAAPVGILAGVFLSEFAGRRSAGVIRFTADVMVGLPSVVVGVVGFALLVVPVQHYSAWAGIGALAIIMLPFIVRSTEEMLRLVPGSVRDGSLALGMPVWRSTTVVLRTAAAGIMTGVMLAVARAAGETAPLLFTAAGSRLVNVLELDKPMDALPLAVYRNSGQPSEHLIAQAWGAAFILLLLVLVTNIAFRIRSLTRRRS
jgi:phosphate transport system permease protein